MNAASAIKAAVWMCVLGLSGCIVVEHDAQPTQTYPTEPVAPPITEVPPPAPPVIEQPPYQPPPPAVAVVYQDDLAPYGQWTVDPHYGRCWVPNYTPYGWRPYTVGHWAYTDDGNSIWVSEGGESQWGGIVYHYGQWALTSDDRWIWVPGTVWAPAWVAWRDGGGYCGWAPLPPEACYGSVEIVDVGRYCPPSRFVYVDERNINVTRVDQRIIQNNVTIINRTTNITNITVVNNKVVNRGVPADRIERDTGRQVQRVSVTNASSLDEARRLAATGRAVRYSSPKIEQVHTAELKQNANQQKVDDRQQVEQQKQAERQQLSEQKTQLDQQRQADLQKQAEQKEQERRDTQASHQQEVDAQKEAERQKQADREQQVAADREAQRQKQNQAAEEKRAADTARQQQNALEKQAQREQQTQREQQAQREQQLNQDRQSQREQRNQQQNQQNQGQQNKQPAKNKNKQEQNGNGNGGGNGGGE